jgi:hypothetical protein
MIRSSSSSYVVRRFSVYSVERMIDGDGDGRE